MDASVTFHAAPPAGFSDPALAPLSLELNNAPGNAAARSVPWWSPLLDELAHGMLVIDREGVIVHANLTARRLLASAEMVRCDAGKLAWAATEDALSFQQALGRAMAGRRQLIQPTAGAGSGLALGFALSLAVLPLRHSPGHSPAHFALLLSRTGVSESGLLAAFSRSHRLTRTEEQVLIHLCRSLGAPDIARQMNVAVSTVRSHVRSLCAKTASSGVRELVHRVAVLPPVAPELWTPVH